MNAQAGQIFGFGFGKSVFCFDYRVSLVLIRVSFILVSQFVRKPSETILRICA